MNLEDIMVSEISHSEKRKYIMMSCIRGNKKSHLDSRLLAARGKGVGKMNEDDQEV